MGSRKSMPASSAIWAMRTLSSQSPDQRSGALVTKRPDEQLGPKKPSLSLLSLYIDRRPAIPVRSRTAAMPYFVTPAEPGLGLHVHYDEVATVGLGPVERGVGGFRDAALDGRIGHTDAYGDGDAPAIPADVSLL